MKKRPVGVTVFGLLFILTGIFFSGMFLLLRHGRDPEGVAAIVGLATIIVGIGLLMLHRWARWVTLMSALAASVVSVLAVASSVWYLLNDVIAMHGERAAEGTSKTILVWGLIVWMIFLAWNGSILWYFLRPGVKAQFERNINT